MTEVEINFRTIQKQNIVVKPLPNIANTGMTVSWS